MPPADVELLKQQRPLADVMAANGVKLRRRGNRFVARCPFHEEQHPSLVVYPETESFYCFGCGASGDVIDFLRRKEGIGFREALRRLAANAPAAGASPMRRRLTPEGRLILQAACGLYHESLLHHPPALRCLEQRGIPPSVISSCRLGYSEGNVLRPLLQGHGLSLERAVHLGLLRKDGSEALEGRVTVPELREGQCIWMVGRTIDGRGLKYFGLSLPKPVLGYERARGRRRVFVTEGPFDYLTGIAWKLPICALLGTHARAERLAFLARAREVVLVLDNDEPGRKAATTLASTVGDRVTVLELPGGIKDLNELGTRPDGRQLFFDLLRSTSGQGDQ